MRNHAACSTADRYQEIPEWQVPRDHRSEARTCARLSPRAEIEELLTLERQAAPRVSRGENPKQVARTRSVHRHTHRQRSIISNQTQIDLGYYPSTKAGQVQFSSESSALPKVT
jgi:hypothetical protein